MADALGHRLKTLQDHLRNSYFAAFPYLKVKVAESFNHLMYHIRDMMAEYENEQVQALYKELAVVMTSEVWDNQYEIMKCIMPSHAEQFLLQMGTRLSWDIYEEITMNKIVVICEQLCSIRYNSNVQEEDDLVGFDQEVETLLDYLAGTSTKHFQIISISGMAGLGKTTLARKLYNDPLIEYKFDFRAWTWVSQVHLKKDLLLGILSSFINDLTDELYKMSDQQLGEKLYRLLKGRKYLVVLDDIWDGKAWNDIKMYFPDDNTGSRILFTSRDVEINLHVQAARPAYVLRLRTEEESWDIFMKKMFRSGVCPPLLSYFGREITRKCEGLPLAIVIAAGLLKNDWSESWWRNIAESLTSFMVSDPSQYNESLALSYNHLPPQLRPCFLFFGSFPEDYEVPVTKLLWLWMAQGLIHETESRILEDVAEDFLMYLIKRSLVMASNNSADGRIKSCHIHDLLRDFCLRRAEEENFSLLTYKHATVPASYTTSTNPPPLPTHSGLCYPVELGNILLNVGSVLGEKYKSLTVLDMEYVPLSVFPSDVTQLVNLRYLAIQAHDGSPRASIANLVKLQILLILSRKNVLLPKTIWNMVNLRHLYIKSGENLIEEPLNVRSRENNSCPVVLAGLQTLCQVSPRSCQSTSLRTPNLRKLGLCGPLISSVGDLEFPNICSLEHLQKLKLLNTIPYSEATRSCNPLCYPEKLKKLTLSNTAMDWEELWTFAWLPNLEVLKLKFLACIGEIWETGEAVFRGLKVLKLHDLDMRQWVCSRDNFPKLGRLVMHRCLKLETIPLDLGRILTLEVVEVSGCNTSAHKSALEIKEEQRNEGNCFLKVHSKPVTKPEKENRSSRLRYTKTGPVF